MKCDISTEAVELDCGYLRAGLMGKRDQPDAARRMQALSARVSELEAASAWQPIKDAPDIMGEVLVWAVGWPFPSIACRDEHREFYCPNTGRIFYPEATHWRPLPTQPTEEGG